MSLKSTVTRSEMTHSQGVEQDMWIRMLQSFHQAFEAVFSSIRLSGYLITQVKDQTPVFRSVGLTCDLFCCIQNIMISIRPDRYNIPISSSSGVRVLVKKDMLREWCVVRSKRRMD